METTQLIILIAAILIVSGIGFLSGFGLAWASHVFAAKTSPLLEKVLAALPGSNCGSCGFPSCAAAAEAMVKGTAEKTICKPGGAITAEAIYQILGGEKAAVPKKELAAIFCGAGPGLCEPRAVYVGEKSCRAANLSAPSLLSCSAGCLGFGDCVKACQFNAFVHQKENLPKIIREKCTGCGKCVAACPKNIIRLVPARQKVLVLCSTKERGAAVRKFCKVGCIDCHLCEKQCPEQAFARAGRIPQIDPDKCKAREICIATCPQKTIKKI
jgi:Na+-translocating ferredoxin:NAD+ oxidoreductase RNF subunit RnfB